MTSFEFLTQLIQQYGLYAVFFLVMVEGDITLLLAGVLAQSAFFGDSAMASFARVLLWASGFLVLSIGVAAAAVTQL